MPDVNLTTVFLGLMCPVVLSGVPWAYCIGARLARMESELRILCRVKDDITALQARLQAVELHCAEVCSRLLESRKETG